METDTITTTSNDGGIETTTSQTTTTTTTTATTTTDDNMLVLKRNGKYEEMRFDKILNRIKKLGKEADLKALNYTQITLKVISQLYDKIKTTEIDRLTAEYCASLCSTHYEYSVLASHILISNHHKNTTLFYNTMKKIYNNKDVNGNHSPLINERIWKIINENGTRDYLESIIDYKRDYLFDYFGFKTLEKAYLIKINKNVVERPQHLWLRVSLAIHENEIYKNRENGLALVKECYDLMSQKYFIHATPTLFNAGTLKQQLSSCFLVAMEDDSLEGIYDTLKDCARISKHSGGIGLHIHNVRAFGSKIRSTNGESTGVCPMLRVFNNTARYINQGGKRNGSIAIYLEPWHSDIENFLDMKTNQGDEEMKARDLFYALWIPDLFMHRVKSGGKWSLFCPDKCPGLENVYGEKFNELYEYYENNGMMNKSINARDLWYKILDTQMETGTPYLLFKDACNKKSNQSNVGVIKSSNLCTEIIQYSSEEETAVCNLASLGLPSFVEKLQTAEGVEHTFFNYEKLYQVVKIVVKNLNNIIDINFYPTEKARRSNMRLRPIGIGVQGLADVFFTMNIPFHSQEAKKINKLIFETIYYASLEKSVELAIEDGKYECFDGSPASKGILQFDMWDGFVQTNERYDWDALKERIKINGLRNSLLVSLMPTATTSQILGFNECFEPITSNIYTRGTLAGEFIVINKYLIKEFIQMGIWNEKIKNNIIANNGSIQQLDFLPQEVRDKYKIVWEIPQKHIIDMASDRGVYICQSQSMNLWVEDPSYKTLTLMYFHAFEKGLKTGIYYLRRKAKASPQKFTIEPESKKNIQDDIGDDICEMCSA